MENIDKKTVQAGPLTRDKIKERFRNGMIPSEDDFILLIESMVNIKEEGFFKKEKEGLVIYADNQDKRFLSLYRTMSDEGSFLNIEKNEENFDYSLRMKPGKYYDDELKKWNENGKEKELKNVDSNAFFFHLNGNLGVGKKSDRNIKVDVDGQVAMTGRVGTHKTGYVKANRKWQPIIEDVDGFCAFEIVARAGFVRKPDDIKGSDKYAMLHAVAVHTCGNSKSITTKTSAHTGYFWNKLNIRWRGSANKYRLEIRTNSNYVDQYGIVPNIYYSVMSLWDEKLAQRLDLESKLNEK